MSPTDISLQGPGRVNPVTMPSSELRSFGISKILFYEWYQFADIVSVWTLSIDPLRNIINLEILSIQKYYQFINIVNLEILSI